MKAVGELQRKRFQFLKLLYDEMTDFYKAEERTASDIFDAPYRELGKRLGFTEVETEQIIDYLQGERLIKKITFRNVMIEHAGIKEIEDALFKPEKPTEHFPPNIVYIIQQVVFDQHGQHVDQQYNAAESINTNTSNPAARRDTKKGSTLPENINQAASDLLAEISNYFQNFHIDQGELERKYDAWELLVSPKLDDDRQRLHNLCTTIERMIESDDLSGFSRSEIRKEVKELTDIAKRPRVWGGML